LSRDVIINIGCTVFTLAYIALCFIVGILATRQDSRQAQPKEIEFVEFTEEELNRLYELKRRYAAEEVQP
jgi:hypothetical protein